MDKKLVVKKSGVDRDDIHNVGLELCAKFEVDLHLVEYSFTWRLIILGIDKTRRQQQRHMKASTSNDALYCGFAFALLATWQLIAIGLFMLC